MEIRWLRAVSGESFLCLVMLQDASEHMRSRGDALLPGFTTDLRSDVADFNDLY